MLVLVSCGGLSGTYEGMLFDLKFKGDNVTVIADDHELKGTYEIEEKDGKKTISFDFVDEDEATDDQKYVLNLLDALLGGKVNFKEDGDTITIGFSKFTKK
jgi:hypothetical protein